MQYEGKMLYIFASVVFYMVNTASTRYSLRDHSYVAVWTLSYNRETYVSTDLQKLFLC
jgi:hypothetical protein